MQNLANKVVVVTGAGSGIGRALAQELAAQGCRLALTDVNDASLQETVTLLKLPVDQVMAPALDVSDRAAMLDFSKHVNDYFGQVDVVINNAGINCSGAMEEVDFSLMEKVFDVNMWGVIYGSRFFLPYLRQRPEATLVNVASINSMVPFPTNGPYNMSKYAVLGLNETLMLELADSNVKVLSVHPGGIRTNINRGALNPNAQLISGFDKIAKTTAEEAATAIVGAIKKGKSQLFIGKDAKFMQLCKRISVRLGLWSSMYVVKKISQ